MARLITISESTPLLPLSGFHNTLFPAPTLFLNDPFDCWSGITDDEITLSCINCGNIAHDPSQLFVSSRCIQPHYYCSRCVAQLISESLSLLNEMATCILPECDKPFKLTISQSISLNEHLSFPYQAQKHNIKQYKFNALLVTGYIRQKSHNNFTLIPMDIISLIHDFYKLVCYTLLDCTSCHSRGYHTKPCSKCNGFGNTKQCIQCTNGQIRTTEPCPGCGGFGYRVDTRPCDCYQDVACNACDGCGIRKGAGGRGECATCDGTGRMCAACAGQGIICNIDDCDRCKGERVVAASTACGLCLGSGKHEQYYSIL